MKKQIVVAALGFTFAIGTMVVPLNAASASTTGALPKWKFCDIFPTSPVCKK